MVLTYSMVNNRFKCAQTIRRTARDKDLGVISNVKLQRIGFLVWYLQFEVETTK